MKEAEMKVAAEMQLGRFALKTHGLRMTEMRLRVLGFLEQADKFALLGMLDDMMDDLGRNGVRALGQNVQVCEQQHRLALAHRPAPLVGGKLVLRCCGELRQDTRPAAPFGKRGGRECSHEGAAQ